MYYMLLYDVVPDYLERRGPLREGHLKLAREAHARGELLLAGAFADPVDGAALVFVANDRFVAERFARNDPLRQGRTGPGLEGPQVECRCRRRMTGHRSR